MSTFMAWARIPLPLRITAFRLLEWASELRQGRHARVAPLATPAAAKPSVWIFVSTIGELNAIEPFITQLLNTLGQPELTLLTDRTTYGDAYRARYPQAHIEVVTGTWAQARELARRRPPALLVVAEIPCLLHDAPCRFSFALVHTARQAGARIVMVNGWLYGYTPASRIDDIEQRLFGQDYLRAFDLMLVQTEAVRSRLLAEGAAPDRVLATGNIKFDAAFTAPATLVATPLSEALAQRGPGPVIVAGSVTETADQAALLAAFVAVRREHPSALLVLAPRHPENRERMAALAGMLDASGLAWRLRSQHPPADGALGPVLVLDTMGELRGCYRAATLAYVGTDHNVLEPLSFGKPVFVSGQWEPTYPSYPVYQQLLQADVLHAVARPADLGQAWLMGLAAQATRDNAKAHADAVLQTMRGAVARDLAAMQARGMLTACMSPTAPAPVP